MQVNEQAVEAAQAEYRRQGEKNNWYSWPCDESMMSILTAAAPYMSGVKVKALEWTGAPNDAGREGLWFIAIDHFGRQYEILKMFNGQKGEGWDYRSSWYPSLEAAKAAAQSDYEKRILSAIELSSAREQALEEAETQGNLKQWNIQDHLKTPGSIAEYLQATLDEGGSELLINAVSDVIRALKSQPAPQTGGGE